MLNLMSLSNEMMPFILESYDASILGLLFYYNLRKNFPLIKKKSMQAIHLYASPN